MALSSYAQVFEILTPPWLRGKWGARWISALGGRVDWLRDRAKGGVSARFVLQAPVDGLDLLGRERDLLRIPGEADEAYRLRVWRAWEMWLWAGTDTGVLRGMAAIGWAAACLGTFSVTWPTTWPAEGHVAIISPAGWAWHCPDGDNAPEHFGRFWVLADWYAEHGAAPAKLRGAQVTRGTTVRGPVTTVTLAEHGLHLATIRKWKDAQATCPLLILITSDGGFADVRGPFNLRGPTRTRGGSTFPIPVGEP